MPAAHETRPDAAAAPPAGSDGALPARLLLLAALAAVVFVRIRLAAMPLERDEGEYAYLGQLMLGGVPPYQAAFNMKWPGTYAGYAAIMALLGQSAAGIRVGLIAVNVLTAGFVYLIARRCAGAAGACLAAAVYLVLSVSPSVLGLAAHAAHFVVLPGLMAVWLVQLPEGHRQPGRLLLAGVAAGTAAIMKQSGAAFFGFVVFWVALSACREKPGLRAAAARLGAAAAGFALPIGGMLALVAAAGTFPRFWFWTWDYARAYAGVTTLAEGAHQLGALVSRVFLAAPLLAVLVAAGALVVGFGRRHVPHRAFVLGFALCSFLAVCPGLYFSPHYLIQFLPAAALLVGTALGPGLPPAGPGLRFLRGAGAPAAIVALAAAQLLYAGRSVFFVQAPAAAARTIYGFNPFPEAEQVGRYLAAHCPAGARIAVIGSEPEIYFYARRRGATGYLYVYPMTERQPYARRMESEFMAEIEQGAPEYVVLVNAVNSWYSRSRLGAHAGLLQWFQGYARENLTLVGLVEILDDRTVYRWTFDAPEVRIPPRVSLAVFRRLPGPAAAAGLAGQPARVTVAW